MIIKFKLLSKYLNKNGFFELRVAECTYNNQLINKICLVPSQETKSLISQETDKLFIIKNVQEDEIELNFDTLKINSIYVIIMPVKTDFFFAVDQIQQVNDGWEIGLAFIHLWNGEKIKKIHLPDDSQYKKMIEDSKDKYLFQLSGIKRYNIFLPDNLLAVSKTNFRELSKAAPLQIDLKNILVKNLEVLSNNTYLFDAQEALADSKLKDYKKVKLVTNKRINEKEIISFNIPDLRTILQRDKEDKILRVEQDYRFLIKFQPESEISVDNSVDEEIQEFLAKYQNDDDYQKKINVCQTIVKKISFYLVRISRQKTRDDQLEELIKQQNNLSHQLEVFVDQTKLQKKTVALKEKFFSTEQNSDQLDQLRKELKKIDQEFLLIEEKIKKLELLADEYLKENWVLVLQEDLQFQQLVASHGLNNQEILDNLTWEEVHPLLEEGIDYSGLKKLIQEKKSRMESLNYLGYELTEITPGERYEKWNQAQIKKGEALEAIYLNYSPEQWKDPQYQEYKERKTNRILADSIIEVLRRKWIPSLNNTQKENIKNSRFSFNLVENIYKVQRENFLAHAKIYFKNFIDQELKKSPNLESELNKIVHKYEKEIDRQSNWTKLIIYVRRIIEKIKEVHNNKITSIKELKKLVKKNISETLTKSKLKKKDLSSQYQDWLSDIEKMESKSQITQHEQKLLLLLEEIKCLLQQKQFPNLDLQAWIKQVEESITEEQIETLLKKEKRKWLVTWQINLFLRRYHELQDEENYQSYSLQESLLREINLLLDIFPIEELAELKKKLLIALNNFRHLSKIIPLQNKFNEVNSLKEKEEILHILQNSFQKWIKEEKLSEREMANWKEVETKLILVKQGKSVENLSISSKPQIKLNLLNLPQEAPEESETKTENGSPDLISQQILTSLAVGCLILIFLWRWYRKKQEKDPFW